MQLQICSAVQEWVVGVVQPGRGPWRGWMMAAGTSKEDWYLPNTAHRRLNAIYEALFQQ